MTGRRLDLADSERAAIALAYAHGEDATALAERFGIPRTSVYAIATRFDVARTTFPEYLMPKVPLTWDQAEWVNAALCAQVDPELFFPGKGESTAPAKRVCGGCPVKAECLEWALANTMSHGVWGGQSDQERKRLRRRGAA